MTAETQTDYQKWSSEIRLAQKEFKAWTERGKKVVKRYRDERSDSVGVRFNVLWSNIQTVKPCIISRTPKASVRRRYDDQDAIGRIACTILERCLDYENEHFRDFEEALHNVVEDRLLPGRGIAWVRYVPETGPAPEYDTELSDDVPEVVLSERSPVDYVYWQDFLHSPARTWQEVRWVSRKVYLSREQLETRFPKYAEKIPLDHAPVMGDDSQIKDEAMKKAEIYEVWCKDSQTVYWFSLTFDKILDEVKDPLEIEGFFPCPKPLYATTTTSSLVPIPDFCEYQDQAEQLDRITQRIKALTEACKVTGLYAGDSKEVQRVFNEGSDNTLIPVANWAMFAERGGIDNLISWVPIDMVVKTLSELRSIQQDLIKEIYEITGFSDLLRGVSDPDETATAQNIKSTFGSMRLRSMQKAAIGFASAILRMKAMIMCNHYQPETLIQQSGIMQTDDGQNQENVLQALQLLKQSPERSFRIEVDADSMVIMDEKAQQADAVQFLESVGGFMDKAIQGATAYPAAAPILGKLLLYGVRNFKNGQQLEVDFEQLLKNMQPPPDPNAKAQQEQQAKMQADQQKMQMQMQIEQAKLQAQSQQHQMELQQQGQFEQMKANLTAQLQAHEQQVQAQQNAHQNQLEAQREQLKQQNEAQLEQLRIAQEDRISAAENQVKLLLGALDRQTKLEVAEITAQTTLDAQQISAAQQAEKGDA